MPFNTVADALRWAAKAFDAAARYYGYGHGTDNPWDDAVALTVPALGCLPIDIDQSVLRYV